MSKIFKPITKGVEALSGARTVRKAEERARAKEEAEAARLERMEKRRKKRKGKQTKDLSAYQGASSGQNRGGTVLSQGGAGESATGGKTVLGA